MQRFLPYLLSFLLIGVVPAQEEPAASPKTEEPAAAAETEAKEPEIKTDEFAEKAAEEDTSEAIVKNGKVRHRRDAFRTHRQHRPTQPHIRTDFTVKKGETSGDIVIIDGILHVEGEVDGNIVAIASKAFIDGPVRGSVVVVPGP